MLNMVKVEVFGMAGGCLVVVEIVVVWWCGGVVETIFGVDI